MACRVEDNICEGCGRSKKESREWAIYSNKRRAAIMERLPGAIYKNRNKR